MTRSATRPATDENNPAAKISTRQMRQMHALLRDHGITGDKAVHDYIAAALREHGDEPVEHRNDLTPAQAARIIADLEAAPVVRTAADAGLDALRAPFDPVEVGKLPRSTCKACSDSPRKVCDQHSWVSSCGVCGGRHSSATIHLDYVGHADVTARLLAVDPLWTWEPMVRDPQGNPSLPLSLDRDGNLWINLTVLGVTRPGVGDGKNAKERIGDALRNAAMRFGVALDLWAKGDREWAHADKDGTDHHPDEAPPRQQQADPPPAPYVGPTADELHAAIASYADRQNISVEQITAKWRREHGDLTMDQYAELPPQALAALERVLGDYLAAHPPAPQPVG